MSELEKQVKKYDYNGKQYYLISSETESPCCDCSFGSDSEGCDSMSRACSINNGYYKEVKETIQNESTYKSQHFKGHYDVKNDFTILNTLREQVKEMAKEVKETIQKETELPIKQETTSALATQAGGNHYKIMGIQPVEYIQANNLDYFEGNVVKYVTRHKNKGKEQDIKKAIHYLQLILELQYKETKE